IHLLRPLMESTEIQSNERDPGWEEQIGRACRRLPYGFTHASPESRVWDRASPAIRADRGAGLRVRNSFDPPAGPSRRLGVVRAGLAVGDRFSPSIARSVGRTRPDAWLSEARIYGASRWAEYDLLSAHLHHQGRSIRRNPRGRPGGRFLPASGLHVCRGPFNNAPRSAGSRRLARTC